MSENKIEVKADKPKLNINKKKLAIIITAAVIAVAIITLAVVLLVNAIKKDTWFDYTKADLSQYIEFTKDYKGNELKLDIAKPRDIDVDITILNMLCEDKPEKPLYNGNYVTSPITVKPGDVLLIWYRGYLLDNEGNPIEVDGMCNFAGTEPGSLEIGSNSFVPGFELDLVGVYTGDYNKFSKIKSGAVSDGKIAYVSYSKTVGDSDSKTTASSIRIDLSSDEIDEIYGEGFKEKLLSLSIGKKVDFETTLDEKAVKYTNLVVDFVTTCEDNPILVECYFPYDYNTANLRNENAIFEVYVEKAQCFYSEMPEFTDEYLKGKIEDKDIAITLEKLEEYEGETLVDKYRSFAKTTMDNLYTAEYEAMVEEAMWEYFLSIVKVKKYPEIKVENTYKNYVAQIITEFRNSGGQVYNSYYGSYTTYETIDEYATAYLGLSSTSSVSWQAYVYSLSQDYVKEKLVLYYILREEGLMPTDEELSASITDIKAEYLEEYINQYLEYNDKTREDYKTEEEYQAMVAERKAEVESYYDDQHFEERAHYVILGDEIINWPTVITLDERRAYPVEEDK